MDAIKEAMRRHDIKVFSVDREDLFTFVLQTLEPVSLEALEDFRKAVGIGFRVKNVVMRVPNKDALVQKITDWESKQKDAVSHPSHYNQGRIEVIEAIEDWGLDFHRGNAVKYIARAGKKDPAKETEDLEKARWYLARAIEIVKASANARPAIKPNDMKRT